MQFVKRSLDPMNLIFKEKQAETKTEDPATVADPNDPAVIAAKRREALKATGGSGRNSTLLSGSGSGGNYSSATMG